MVSIHDIEKMSTVDELKDAAQEYNWDDGFAIPISIANHRQCDLSVALSLFWLSEAIVWFTGEVKANEYNQPWASFCSLITNRILNGYYKVGSGGFTCPLTKVQVFKYQKQGVPPVLLSNIEAANA